MNNISSATGKKLGSIDYILSVKEGNFKINKIQGTATVSVNPNKRKRQLQLATTPIALPRGQISDKKTVTVVTETLRPMPQRSEEKGRLQLMLTLIKFSQPLLMRRTITVVLVIMVIQRPMPDM